MKLYIRDDDVSHFTSPDEIEQAYGSIMKKGPVSFAVIPFSVRTWNYGEPGTFKQDTSETFPIHLNTDLTSYLRQLIAQKQCYLMMHGYNHIYYPCPVTGNSYQVPEFARPDLDFYTMLKEGRAYLEDTFSQRITWFIPPSNALCYESYMACENLRLNIPYVFSVRQRDFSVYLAAKYLRFRLAGALGISTKLRLRGHTEIECYGITKSATVTSNGFLPTSRYPAIFTHYWEVNKFSHVRDMVNELVTKSSRLGSFDELA
jgi:hypothetical protein